MNKYVLFAYLFCILSLVAEVIIYPGVIENYTHLKPFVFVIVAVFLALYLRSTFSKQSQEDFALIGYYVFAPFITFIAFVLRTLEFFYYPNYIYTNIHVDLLQTGLLGLYVAIVSLPFITSSLVKKYPKTTVIVTSFLLYQMFLLFWQNNNLYLRLISEDGFVEYLTFFMYFCASLFPLVSLQTIWKFHMPKMQKYLVLTLVIIISSVLVVIAGEEISWGQRIFNIETPESIRTTNTQGEINLHNNKKVFHYVYIGYTILNLYGLLSWMLYDGTKKILSKYSRLLLRMITSRWYLFLLFLPNLIYVCLRLYYGSRIFDAWEEVSELYLSIGICVMVYLNYRSITSKKTCEEFSK